MLTNEELEIVAAAAKAFPPGHAYRWYHKSGNYGKIETVCGLASGEISFDDC